MARVWADTDNCASDPLENFVAPKAVEDHFIWTRCNTCNKQSKTLDQHARQHVAKVDKIMLCHFAKHISLDDDRCKRYAPIKCIRSFLCSARPRILYFD
eukprot:6182205-Pleurochrysis_carterae.AAC.2